MKIISIIISVLAIVLIIYNATMINLNEPFQGNSLTAIITILTALCAILLLQILLISKKIEAKSKGKK
ncbi:hypothetical protein C1T31_00015 [Hanstruepera neustonica]|uniref:Uncharacterized protein n=1 Tax=Hanstruepera neustonica TaxID=1445657 RepID=A0A2K1E2Q7_9FLAO|nr:hypothetical protein [Hanstruepera neustonica]PNQ74572.1 hypothetical protein C1T31_00015 [Hanstruepera neustonica]